MRFFTSIRLFCLVALLATQAVAEELPLQDWVNEAIKQGGGVVTIPPGVHVLPKGLVIKNAKKLAIRGMDKETCILKLPPVVYAECAELAEPGSKSIPLRRASGLKPGMRLRIEADGAINSFTNKPTPYLLAKVESVQEGKVNLIEPLKFPVPVGTVIRDDNGANIIHIQGGCEDIEIANLTLDGGKLESDPPVLGHTQLCAVFASGEYKYETGPKGPKPKGIVVRDCIIRNLFGRAIAFYSVEKSTVERCSIMDGNDEAIDFDHFVTDCVARGNNITRCRIAFELNDATNCLVEGNAARDCTIGVNLWRWCKMPDLNKGNIIRNNLFYNMSGNSLQIAKGTASNVIENNEIEKAGRNGISLSGDAQVLKGNIIRGAKMKDIAINEGKHQIEAPKADR